MEVTLKKYTAECDFFHYIMHASANLNAGKKTTNY